MAIKPILFNTDMVRAIMDGRKNCTRRIVKPQPDEKHTYPLGFVTDSTEKKEVGCFEFGINEYGGSIQYAKPQYQPGDILYVRETWGYPISLNSDKQYVFRADKIAESGFKNDSHIWHPSIHMPKKAARIWLNVTNVRVERLQDITETQTEEEGFLFTPPCLHQTGENYCDIDGPCGSKIKYCDMSAGELFGKVLWDSTIKKSDIDIYGWDANPWVWVIEFERCEKPKEV
ncbi:MAG: hypothetical protein EGR94_01880 [Blautia obeum]|jgi:hypothetical protein|nr:hypothetical protein [uncultured Blautia sp.]MBD8948625.1 hypothetical protein [Blautia obeum]